MARQLSLLETKRGQAGGTAAPLSSLYTLFSLARACVLGRVSRLGKHEWYETCAPRVLTLQRRDGAFAGARGACGAGDPMVDTCFALLFLRRGPFSRVGLSDHSCRRRWWRIVLSG